MPLPIITLKRFHHRGGDQIGLWFDYNTSLIQHVKKLPEARWSSSNRCWYVTEVHGMLHQLFQHFKGVAWLENKIKPETTTVIKSKKSLASNPYKKQLTEEAKEHLQFFRKWMKGKRYSESTVNTYAGMLKSFFGFHHNKKTTEIEMEDVERFNFEVIVQRNYSIVYQRQMVSALKLYFKQAGSINIDPELLERPKRSRKLPIVLSREEVMRLLIATPNLKHRCILAMLYGSGLRISELINLKVSDIDFARKQVFIRQAKRRKDRVVGLSEKIYGLLNNYLQSYQPDTYLFNGQNNLQYTAGSVRQFLQQSVKRAGIKKRISPHTLRHTYATHLLESGVDLKYVQELLGHSKPETTQIYLHITQKQLLAIHSPLDNLLKGAEKEQTLLDKMNRT